MHTDVYKMFYGNYKFTAEHATSSETSEKQLTVWFAEKADIKYVDLSQFPLDLLLKALHEPLQSRIQAQLEEEKITSQQALEAQIAMLQHPFQATKDQQAQKLPSKVKRQIRHLRQQMKSTEQRLEVEFVKHDLMPLERQSFDLDMLQAVSQVFGEARFLRDFYFEEANEHYIRDFCQKFALDEVYRQDVQAGRTRWARRDALFLRNLLSITSKERPFTKGSSKAHEFFQWLDVHCEEILALPEYQWLQEIDSILPPSIHELDFDIRPAIEVLTRIPGVAVQFSCQGVSGKIRFQEYDLLTVSSHREYGFVSFSALSPFVHDAIIDLLSSYANITIDPMPYNFAQQLVLRSTGNNLFFRKELLELAQHVLEQIPADQHTLSQIHHISRWQAMVYPEYCPGTSAPGGILPSRLKWLCQPEQVEQTLHLLFYLNHWAKARDYLLYDDRQGLYEVKTVVLQQAYRVGAIRPVAYIDGSETFAHNYSFDVATDIATEVFTDRLTMSFDGEDICTNTFNLSARKLFTCIMGYEAKTFTDSKELDIEQAKTFIYESLQALVEQARFTRQPIPSEKLAALFIQPADLLEVHLSKGRLFPGWEELDVSEAKQLDPEGMSLIAFQYDSSTAHYVFHLPFRVAEKFLSQRLIHELQSHTSKSREAGIFYGRAISEVEAQEYPVANLLRELLVDISAICPHGLIKKEQRIGSSRTWPTSGWDNDEDDDDDFGMGII